jgi:hypothetical protein
MACSNEDNFFGALLTYSQLDAGMAVSSGQAARCPAGSAKPSGAKTAGPGRDRHTAVVPRRHVPHGLGELPSMACYILDGAVPLAVLPVCGRFEHACSVRTGTLELGTDVLDPDTDEVYRPILFCRPLAPAFSDDDCSIRADVHLRPVTLAYPRALNKAERCAQPRHRGPHVRVGQHRHDGRWPGSRGQGPAANSALTAENPSHFGKIVGPNPHQKRHERTFPRV